MDIAVKPAVHHWWPRTLSFYWKDVDGKTCIIRPDESIRRDPPEQFGGIKNAHNVKMGGSFDSSFEQLFDKADTQIHDLVSWILSLECSRSDTSGPILQRILAQPLSENRLLQLARTTASLMARSPRTRNSIGAATDFYRSNIGLGDSANRKALIAVNQKGLYNAYRKIMERAGRWAILFSDSKEFIFGDGFLHNFPAAVYGLHSGRKCILPLTPTISIAYIYPTSYPAEPKLVTIKLSDSEVDFFNECVQVYSSKFIFYRSRKPDLIDAFKKACHLEYRYHQVEWLEGFLDDLSQYNLWGPGGTPSISEGYFSKGLEMTNMLEKFVND